MEAARLRLDIAMVFDEFAGDRRPRVRRTVDGDDHALAARRSGDEGLENNTFGIVQGGFHEDPAAALEDRGDAAGGRGRRAFGRRGSRRDERDRRGNRPECPPTGRAT